MIQKVCKLCGSITLLQRSPRTEFCERCDKSARAKEYYARNKDYIVGKATSYQKANPGVHQKASVAWRRRARIKMIAAYGGVCSCCGEHRWEFLTIDHINGNGNNLRRLGEPSGAELYKKLEKLGYPKDEYQLLCMNCNHAKGLFGICPHQVEKQLEVE